MILADKLDALDATGSTAEAIDFDGTNDYLTKSSDLTGNSDGTACTFSCWYYRGSTNSYMYVANDTLGAGSPGIEIYDNGSTIAFTFRNAARTNLVDATISSVTAPLNTWVHFLLSFDVTNASLRGCYLNDVLQSVTWATYTNGTIDFTNVYHRVGANTGSPAGGLGTKRMAHLYLDKTYRDLSITANRRLFVTADLKPANINYLSSNLALNSESLTDTWGSLSGQLDIITATPSNNVVTAPDGALTGGELTISANGGRATLIINDTNGTTKNSSVTVSAFCKSSSSSSVGFHLVCQTNGATYTYRSSVVFNLSNGTAGTVSNTGIDGSTPSGIAAITSVGNGWYRCSLTFATYNGANALNATLAELRPNEGQSTGSVYVWGRQFETGSSPTSYAKTVGYPVYKPILYLPLTDPTQPGKNLGTGGDFTLTGVIARSGRGPNQYNVPYSTFDGSADYLSAASITGIADGKQFTFHCNFNSNTFAGNQYIFFVDNSRFRIFLDTSFRLNIIAADSSGTTVLNAISAANTFVANRNYVLDIAIDLTSTSNRYVYINGASTSMTWSAYSNTQIDFTQTAYLVGSAQAAPTLLLNGRLGAVWFNTSYIDLSVQANREKFVTGTGIDAKPVDLGANGELPTGTSPLIYLPMYGNNAGKNYGTGGDFTVNSGPYTGARGPNEFWGNKATFNGVSTNYLNRTGGVFPSDSATFSMSFHVNRSSTTVTHEIFEIPNGTKFQLKIDSSDRIWILGINSSGTVLLNCNTGATSTGNPAHIQICIDLSNTSKRFIYVNGVSQTVTWSTYINGQINLSESTNCLLGRYGSSSAPLNGSLSEFYFTTEYIDFSQESNRLKFRDAFGNPVDLGADGSTPTGNKPAIYMRFDPSSFGTNSGTGGNFTVNGTITDGGQL